MKKRNGFTLIELLAVIVILAVIALIAVPRIIELLNKSRLSAAEDSTYGIVEAAESYITDFMLKNHGTIPSEDLEFSCDNKGCTLANELTNYNLENLQTLEFKGKKPTGGAITISEGGNKVTAYGLLINNFICNYGDGDADCIDVGDIGPTKEEPPSTQHEGVKAIVYLDPTNLTNKCDKNNINSDTKTKAGCMKWYAYDEDDSTYTMILDHNTTATVAWNSNNDNQDSSQIISYLESDTKDWNKSLNARLISAEEIAKIVNKDDFDSKTSGKNTWFYFQDFTQDDTNTKNCATSKNCTYAWLYDRTSLECTNYGCLNNSNIETRGYWTSTPVVNTTYVWGPFYNGHFGNGSSNELYYRGIRPVITISKSLINN